MISQAVRVALVVGTILVAINQGAALREGPLRAGLLLRIGLTYAVPFLVSLYSMVGMVPQSTPGQRSGGGGTYRCRSCPGPGGGEAVVAAGAALPECPHCGVRARWIRARGT